MRLERKREKIPGALFPQKEWCYHSKTLEYARGRGGENGEGQRSKSKKKRVDRSSETKESGETPGKPENPVDGEGAGGGIVTEKGKWASISTEPTEKEKRSVANPASRVLMRRAFIVSD